MKVTGHRTRAEFDRYHIVSPADRQDVATKLTGTLTGPNGPPSGFLAGGLLDACLVTLYVFCSAPGTAA
jgi:hypothetical protein